MSLVLGPDHRKENTQRGSRGNPHGSGELEKNIRGEGIIDRVEKAIKRNIGVGSVLQMSSEKQIHKSIQKKNRIMKKLPKGRTGKIWGSNKGD